MQFYLLYIYSQSWVVWVVCISTRTFSFINTYIYPSVDRFTFRDVREREGDLLTLTDDVGFTRVFIRRWKKNKWVKIMKVLFVTGRKKKREICSHNLLLFVVIESHRLTLRKVQGFLVTFFFFFLTVN